MCILHKDKLSQTIDHYLKIPAPFRGGISPPRPVLSTCFNDFDRFCHFELEKISDEDPAITLFKDFDRFWHFELEQIRDEDPAITFLNDVDRFSAVEGQTYFGNVLGGGRHK